MTQQAQFALRRMIEQYSHSVRFMIICNFANKIIPALVSRCTSFRFSVLPELEVRACIEKVAAAENLGVGQQTVKALQHVSKGDLRKVLNLLQSLSIVARAAQKLTAGPGGKDLLRDGGRREFAPAPITEKDVYRSVGECTPAEIKGIAKQLVSSSDYDELLKLLTTQKAELHTILQELHVWLSRLQFQSVDQRKAVIEALAKCEFRFSQSGGAEPEKEAATLVDAVLTVRRFWVAAGFARA